MSPPRRHSDDLHLLADQLLTEAEPPATTVPACGCRRLGRGR